MVWAGTCTDRGALHELTILQRTLSDVGSRRQHNTAAQLVKPANADRDWPIPSTPDVHSQAQWAQAVAHENEKLHQLTNLQKAIVSSLQEGHKATSAAVRRADELARTSQHAQRDSLEAGKLHTILLQHTGHAKVGLGHPELSASSTPMLPLHGKTSFHSSTWRHDLQHGTGILARLMASHSQMPLCCITAGRG